MFILWFDSFMVHNIGEKRSKSVLLAYLILALMGSAAVSTGEAFCFEYSNNDRMGSGGYFSSIGHTVDWLAEDVPTIGKAHGYSNSPLRNGLLRVFVLAGIIAIAMYPADANPEIIKNNNISTIKNPVLLKLRI